MKPTKQEAVGVEVTRTAIHVVAVDKAARPVFAQTLPLSEVHQWPEALAQFFLGTFAKKPVKKLGVALPLQSQQVVSTAFSYDCPDSQAFRRWLLSLYTGETSDTYIANHAVDDHGGAPVSHILAIRNEEALHLKAQFAQLGFGVQVVDSSLIATANAALKLGKVSSAVIRLDPKRSSWVVLQDGALTSWGEFSVELDAENALYWKSRLQEKLQVIREQVGDEYPVAMAGELLSEASVSDALAAEFASLKPLVPWEPKVLKVPSPAVYSGAWLMALRALEA